MLACVNHASLCKLVSLVDNSITLALAHGQDNNVHLLVYVHLLPIVANIGTALAHFLTIDHLTIMTKHFVNTQLMRLA